MFGPHLAVTRDYFWLFVQWSLLVTLMGPYDGGGIELGLVYARKHFTYIDSGPTI